MEYLILNDVATTLGRARLHQVTEYVTADMMQSVLFTVMWQGQEKIERLPGTAYYLWGRPYAKGKIFFIFSKC
jgi:hypothetical protein